MARLQSQPQIGPIPAELAEPYRHIGRDSAAPAHHAMKRLASNAQEGCNLSDRAALAQKLRQNVAFEENAWMHWRPGDLVAIHRVFGAHAAKSSVTIPSVILLKVHP